MPESIIIINPIAIVLGPIIAVIVTLIYQNFKNKSNDREHLFKVLMAYRKSSQIDLEGDARTVHRGTGSLTLALAGLVLCA